MNRFKMRLLFALFSLLGMSSFLSAATIQVPVVNGAWTYIGVPGYHTVGATSSTSTTLAMSLWKTGTGYEVITDDDTNNTATGLDYAHWDFNASFESVSGAATPPSYSAVGSEVGDSRYSTLGLFVVETGATGAISMASINYYVKGTLAPDGASGVSGEDYNETTHYRSMYIKSPNSSQPDVKVIYRAVYEGDEFRMRFDGSTTEIYKGTFSFANTYDNPQSLTQITDESVSSSDAGSGTYRAIMDVFDLDLSDNNISRLSYIDPAASGSSNTITSLSSGGDSNLTILSWDSETQRWKIFRANGNTGLNAASDFTEFEAGRGYWVKLDLDNTTTYFTNQPDMPGGFLVGDNGITYPTTYATDGTSPIYNGWNMLSFNDDYLRYSTTGIVIVDTAGTNSVLGDDEINITDSYSANTLTIDFSDMAGWSAIPANSGLIDVNCTAINLAIEANRSRGLTPSLNVKCVPYYDGALRGVALLSTRQFSVDLAHTGTKTVRTLTGRTITSESGANKEPGVAYNRYTSQYGEYALIAEMNPDFNMSLAINGPYKQLASRMSIVCPSVSSSAEGVSMTSNTRKYSTVRTSADTAMTNTQCGTTDAAMLDLNFDGVQESLLLAATERFYIRDNTFVRIFRYDVDSDINKTSNIMIEGNSTAYFDTNHTQKSGALKGMEFNATLQALNDLNATTGVMAFQIDLLGAGVMIPTDGVDLNKTFVAYSVSKSDWDLKENQHGEVFTDIANYDDNASATMGAVKKVFSIVSIMESGDPFTKNSSGVYTGLPDGNYSDSETNETTFSAIVSNLKYNAIWAPDMPSDGPLYAIRGLNNDGDQAAGTGPTGLKPELFITGETNASGNLLSWKVVDLTRDPSTWYDATNQFDLFWTEKEQGYWVYVDGETTNPVVISQATTSSGATIDFVTGEVVRHFQNDIGSAGVGTVFNHFDKTLTVDIKGLVDSTKLVSTTDTYTVEITIGGNTVPMFRTSGGTQFTLRLMDYETLGLEEGGTYEAVIRAADGIGNYATYSVAIDYSAPSTPTVTWNADGTLSVESIGATYIQVHDGNISDQSPSTSKVDTITGSSNSAYNLGTVSSLGYQDANITATDDYNTSAAQLNNKLIYDLRFVGVDGSDDANSLYSYMRQLYYVPVYRGGHVLEVTTATTTDTNPLVYAEDGSSSELLTDTNGNAKDSGVQIDSLSGYEFAVAYLGNANASLTDGTKTAELEVYSSTGTNITIGRMYYSPRYLAKHFYVSFDGKMYVGFFKDSHATVESIVLYEVANSTQTISK